MLLHFKNRFCFCVACWNNFKKPATLSV